MEKGYLFTFNDGIIKFFITPKNDEYDILVISGNGNQCYLTLKREDYKKMVDNFNEILIK